ncbi:L,D-transpeptidase family protein [Nocardioides sp. CN2-186]|uniref:L,D-transpeptidase n=1 Tax=Nocardioides tweenelious TaxID=3156607 RepID=UPI0032B39ACF
MSAHRGAPVRPRYGRLGALGASLAVTVIAVLGGAGALPTASGGAVDHEAPSSAAIGAAADDTTVTSDSKATSELTSGTSSADRTEAESDPKLDTTLPADSGTGKRIVFSQSRQRVWLVTGGKHVQRTYLASGSLTDNLDPGTYSVYSRSEQAYGIDDSGTMKYFVRFTQGDTGAAIGFHDIPIDDGHLVQTRAQLGTPQSHGCIRQFRPDAIALWNFAPLGTTVVVTA